jgi:hypothetical protein
MPLPPAHRLDHTPIVIFQFPSETAWNMDKLRADEQSITARIRRDERVAVLRGRASLTDEQRDELANLEASAETCPWASLADHPYYRFHAGESRYDKRTIEPWLQPTARPAMFILRRLTFAQFREFCHLRRDLSNAPESEAYAVRHGLVRVVDLDDLAWSTEERRSDDAPPLTTVQLEQLRDRVGDLHMAELASAVFTVSLAPTPIEGKR